jgi:hypothetical protein
MIPHTIQKCPAEALPKGSASTRLSMVTHVETPARLPSSSSSYTASSSLSSLTSAQMSMIPKRTTWQKSRQESSFVVVVRGRRVESIHSVSSDNSVQCDRHGETASEQCLGSSGGVVQAGPMSRLDGLTVLKLLDRIPDCMLSANCQLFRIQPAGLSLWH